MTGPTSEGPGPADPAQTDSAGQPWQGRTLPDPGFSGDDGLVDRRLESVLAEHATGDATAYDVQRVLVDVRVMVPVLAVETSSETDDAGLRHDKTTDMATVVLTGADGRKGLLAFTSTQRLADWRSDARPVPVSAPNAAAAALDEDADALLLDLAGPHPFVVEGALLRALAQSRPWVRPAEDPEVVAAVRAAFAEEAAVEELQVTAGEDTDITALVRFAAGLSAEELETVGGRVGGRLAESDVLRDRLSGGLDVRVLPPTP